MTGIEADLFATLASLAVYACILRCIWKRDHLRVEPIAEPQSDESVLQQMGREIAGRCPECERLGITRNGVPVYSHEYRSDDNAIGYPGGAWWL